MDNYESDLEVCSQAGNSADCIAMAGKNRDRSTLPLLKDSVSPWINYDFQYASQVDNIYSADATGSSPKGSDYMRNFEIYKTLLGGFVTDPLPGVATRPGATDKNSDYPLYHCDSASAPLCKSTQEVRLRGASRQAALQEQYPTNSFFKKHSLSGKYSSSYYIRVGTCPQPALTTKQACLTSNANYTWLDSSNTCVSPRYAFIDNSAFAGALPSTLSDLYSLAPQHMAQALSGASVPGYMDLDACPVTKTKEAFSSGPSSSSSSSSGGPAGAATNLLLVFIVLALFWFVIS
jgi:hypothetical protein